MPIKNHSSFINYLQGRKDVRFYHFILLTCHIYYHNKVIMLSSDDCKWVDVSNTATQVRPWVWCEHSLLRMLPFLVTPPPLHHTTVSSLPVLICTISSLNNYPAAGLGSARYFTSAGAGPGWCGGSCRGGCDDSVLPRVISVKTDSHIPIFSISGSRFVCTPGKHCTFWFFELGWHQ